MRATGAKFVMVAVGFAALLGMAQGKVFAQSAAKPPQTAGATYKNIKVLNDIPAEQLGPTMDFFAASLGVECEFCHESERDKDTKKEKETARKMLQMVFAANKDTFNGRKEVTCFTCHRGDKEPTSTPPVAGQDFASNSRSADSKQNLPSVDDVLSKFVAAMGGGSAIQKASPTIVKGTATNMEGEPFPMETDIKAPNGRVVIIHQPSGDRVTSFNGSSGWRRAGSGPIRELRGPELDAAMLEDPLLFAGQMSQVFSDLKVDHTERLDGTTVYVVNGRTKSLPRVRLYFDSESGLLVRLVHFTDSAVGRIPVQIDFADYRDSAGVKIPYRWIVSQVRETRFIYQITNLQSNAAIDDAKFAKPSAK